MAILTICRGQYFSPWAPSLPAYNSFWDGAVGSPMNFAGPQLNTVNAFSKSFDTDTAPEMYRLSSVSPFPARVGEFNTFVPFYNPSGVSRFDWMPSNAAGMSKRDQGTFAYDINEPRYSDIYKDYYRFFNSNLNIKNAFIQNSRDYNIPNNERMHRNIYPEAYDYQMFFDNFDESKTMRGNDLKFLPHKKDEYQHDFHDLSYYKKKLERENKAANKARKLVTIENGFDADLSDEKEEFNHFLQKVREDEIRKQLNELQEKDQTDIQEERDSLERKLEIIPGERETSAERLEFREYERSLASRELERLTQQIEGASKSKTEKDGLLL